MNGWVVADSSVFLATVLPETYSSQANVLIAQWAKQDTRIAAPTMVRYEIVSVIRKSVTRGIISPAEGIDKRNILMSQPVTLMMDDDLLRRGYDLATKYNRPTAYDAQYLAVAERLGCDFWTADERLYNSLSHDLTWVHWLGGFAVQQPLSSD